MRWGRAVAGGLLAEALLIVVVIPGALAGSQNIVTWSVVLAAPITTFVGALWVARRLESQFVVHGAIAGLTAVVVYLVPILAGGIEQPPAYWVGHGLKVAGGIAGGMFAARRAASAMPARAAV